MLCTESLKLENIYRLRYERAKTIERGGPMLMTSGNNNNHKLLVRQHRALQTQAANAILMHQKHCAVCSNQQTMPASLAS